MEDLIIYKLFANRYLDLSDIESQLKKNKNSIDNNYLFQIAEKFRELERKDIIENLSKFLS